MEEHAQIHADFNRRQFLHNALRVRPSGLRRKLESGYRSLPCSERKPI